MGLLFKNNAETTLSSGINNSVTTVPVTSAAVFPTPTANDVFFATIDDGSNIEVVKVTGISSNDLTVVRAQDNTSAAAFASGAKIELRLTAKVLETGTTSITDLDGDTAIFVEQVDDEDQIRMDTGGNQRVLINSNGLEISSGSLSNNSGDMTIDVAGDIIFDADGENIIFKDGGVERGQIDLGSGNFTLRASSSDADMIFRVNDGGTEIVALTIDSSINGAATFSDTVSFKFLNNTWYNSADGANRFYFTASSGATYIKINSYIYFQDSGGSNRFSIDGSGNGVFSGNVTAYGSPSDIRLKENVEVIDNALDKVKQLKGITYDLKSDGNRLTGLIAQDLEKVLPEAVYTEKDLETEEEHLAIRYGNTVGLLVEAIKEQQEQIETLTAKVKELEGK